MKKSIITLLISILIGGIAIYLASQLTVKSNMEDMLPADSPVVEASKDFDTYFQGQELAYILIEKGHSDISDESFHDRAKSYMDEIAESLDEAPYVLSTLYRLDFTSIQPYAWAYLDDAIYADIEAGIEQEDALMIQETIETLMADMDRQSAYEYILNDNESHYLVIIQPYTDPSEFDQTRNEFYDGITGILRDMEKDYPDLAVGLTGGAFLQDLEADNIAFNGLGSTLIVTLICIIVIVILFFGQIKLPLLTLYPLLLGSLMAGAVAYLVFGSINMFSVSFAMLLFGLGIDFAVHFLTRYRELKSQEDDQMHVIQLAMASTGKSIIIGALTTAFAFFTFALAEFKAFEQMGIISAVGILCLCVAMLTIVPALLIVFDRKKQNHPRFQFKFNWISAWIRLNLRYKILVSVMVFLLGILLSGAVQNTRINGDISAIYPEDIPSRINALKIEEAFELNTNTVSLYVDDFDALEKATKELENRPDVDQTQSVLGYMPNNQASKLETIKKLKPYLEMMGVTDIPFKFEEMTIEDLPLDIQKNYVGDQGKLRIDVVPSVDLYEDGVCAELVSGVIDITGKHPVGMPIIMSEVTRMVKRDMSIISLLCLAVTLVFAVGAFRKITYGLLTIVPIILSLYFTLAIGPLISIELNLFSVAAFPLIIGIGIDSAIHLLHRLADEDNLSIDKAVQATGQGILLTTLTTMIGFGSLATINHPGMKSFGLIVVLGMALNFIMVMTLIPIGYRWLSQSSLAKDDKAQDRGLVKYVNE